MQRRTLKLLDDVRDAAQFIIDRASGLSATQYESDRLLRQAVERNFEIIGEAINQLRKCDPVNASRITDTERIVAFRNVLIHGYQLIDHAEVWRVAVYSLPTLLREVQVLLASP